MTPAKKSPKSSDKNATPGYPVYPASEDIYNQEEKAERIDPTDLLDGEPSTNSSLDVPGAELDDNAEAVGAEDEENNYYSLGGDDHNDLEEDNSGNPVIQE
ncbi:MAG TPA: hypothetical protein VFO76_08875 [Candidatus Kapabacteria bacterium]|nr:hypothetical protein [Candidatus Kapabacteria bacterium]